MNNMNTKIKISNPLDVLFDTIQDFDADDQYETVSEGTLATIDGQEAPPEKDEEDILIDGKIDVVYEAAMDAFNTQTAMIEAIEPRYAARNAEVAAGYLSIALNAASVRAKVKGDRKKQAQFIPFTNNKANGNVVASREDIMKMLAVDAETRKS